MVDREFRHQELYDKLTEVQAYRGHELYAAFVHLLGLIDNSYDDDLRVVSPDSLRFKQGAARQCSVLREALISGNADLMPRV